MGFFPDTYKKEVVSYFKQHGIKETQRKFKNVSTASVYLWAKPKKEKLPPSVEVVFDNVRKQESKEKPKVDKDIVVIFGSNPSKIIETFKGIMES